MFLFLLASLSFVYALMTYWWWEPDDEDLATVAGILVVLLVAISLWSDVQFRQVNAALDSIHEVLVEGSLD